MRVIMVNDCAFVGGTLIKYLPSFFNVVHIKRTRRFFDKTFGIFWKILRCTAEYFPIPYDPEIFYPKPLFINRKVKQILLVSPHNFRTKWTDKFLHALSLVKIPLKIKTIGYGKDVEKSRTIAKKLGLNMEFVKEVPHSEMNKLYWSSDLILGSFGIGQLDTIAIEAMACGRPLVHHLTKRFQDVSKTYTF